MFLKFARWLQEKSESKGREVTTTYMASVGNRWFIVSDCKTRGTDQEGTDTHDSEISFNSSGLP